MNKLMDQALERSMVNAVEKAATLVTTDAGRDGNETLASMLMDSDIDMRFAKVATDAFNRRLTIMTFKKTADEKRGDSFPLADANIVAGLMGAESMEPAVIKTASEHTFHIGMHSTLPQMKKTASAKQSKRQPYEMTVSTDGFLRHLKSVMQAQVAAHSKLMGMYDHMSGDIMQKKASIKEDISKLSDFDRSVIESVYGDYVKDLTPSPILCKRAAVKPDNALTRKIDKVRDLDNAHDALRSFISDYQQAMFDFSKTAADLSVDLKKNASSALPMAVMRGIVGTTATAGQAIEEMRRASMDSLNAGFEAAGTLAAAAGPASYHPGKLIDAEFLIKDRFRDRLLSWSDMSADPMFAIYPAEQVFMATQKAMDIDPSLERPDRRELLRAQVGQILAQNGRLNTADMAALATMLHGFAGTEPGAAERADAIVQGLDAVKGPDIPVMSSLFGKSPDTKFTAHDFVALMADQSAKDIENSIKQKSSAKDAEVKLQQEANKAQQQRADAQQRAADAQQRQQAEQARLDQQRIATRQRLFNDWLAANGLHYNIHSTGNQDMLQDRTGNTYSIDEILNNFNTIQGALA